MFCVTPFTDRTNEIKFFRAAALALDQPASVKHLNTSNKAVNALITCTSFCFISFSSFYQKSSRKKEFICIYLSSARCGNLLNKTD